MDWMKETRQLIVWHIFDHGWKYAVAIFLAGLFAYAAT